MPLVTTPMYAVIFLMIVDRAGRTDLTPYAVVAPVLVALWTMSIFVSGEVIDADRAFGVFEAAVATPASFPVAVFGRVFAVTVVALLSLAEVWLVARLVFGVSVAVHHPLVFGLTLAATAVATSGTAVIMASLCVAARNIRSFQNSLTYPFYVLGGVLVPVSFLPDGLEALSAAVFLSWSADLLRDCLAPAAVEDAALRLGVVLVLGAASFAIGAALVVRMLRRVRASGSVGLA